MGLHHRLRSLLRRPEPGDGPNGDATPLFVLGPPRSGTTLVARLLDAHPRVLVTNETRVVTFFEHALREIPTGDRGGLHCARVFGAEVAAALRAHGRAVITDAYRRIAAAAGKTDLRYWGDKNPHLSTALELVAEWFPDARFVVVRRDPRDTACSILEVWSRMGISPPLGDDGVWGVPDDKLRKVCGNVREAMAREDAFVGRLPASRWHRVEYERLLDAPTAVLEPLFASFLQLPAAPAQKAMARLAHTDVHGAVRGKVDFRSRSVGRWRRELSAAQQALCCEVLGLPAP